MSEIEKGRLDELAEEIIAEHRAFVRTFRKAMEHGIRAGGLLTEATGNCELGTWLPWLSPARPLKLRAAVLRILLAALSFSKRS